MIIRRADVADIDIILGLDHGYASDFVWQLSSRESSTDISAALKLAPLPRQVKVPSPLDVEPLRRVVNRCEHLWVMHGTTDARQVFGYVGMAVIPWQMAGWIPCLAVAPAWRRKGVASRLLAAARAQAKADGLHSLVMDVATKNYPATRFCQKNGFRFVGYSDHYYATRDIALFYANRL